MLFLFGYDFTSSSDFYRPLDEFLDWWFFVIPLLVMECYIQIAKRLYSFNKEPEQYTPLRFIDGEAAESSTGSVNL